MNKLAPYSKLKEVLLHPAMTSHYTLEIPYNSFKGWLDLKFSAIFSKGAGVPGNMQEILSLSCSDATIPGSTFFTHEVQNDRTGVTEKIPYRRVYDDQASFSFYVDDQYSILAFFESWMAYIANEKYGGNPDIKNNNYFYRINYPGDSTTTTYKAKNMILTKFEKNYNIDSKYKDKNDRSTPRELKYIFMDAYPISLSSIPISYDQSSLLKVNVSFAFTRYYLQ
jgi:hypothetical protein